MIQKTLRLSERQVEILSKEAREKGISLSDIVRRILDFYIDRTNIQHKNIGH